MAFGGIVIMLSMMMAGVHGNSVIGCEGKCTVPSIAQSSVGSGIKVGVAVNYQSDVLFNDEEVSELVRLNYAEGNTVFTDENACKMKFIQPEQGVFTFENCDRSLARAESWSMEYRLHTALWDKQIGDWMALLPKDQVKDVMQEHIETVITRYADTVRYVDVVNEPFTGKSYNPWRGAFQNTYDMLKTAFQWARNTQGAEQVLVLNENSAELMGSKSNKLFRAAKKLKKVDLLDAVGFQFHTTCAKILPRRSFNKILKNMKRFQRLGLDIHFTEVDIRSCKNEQDSAKAFSKLISMCQDLPACKVLQFWGDSDKHSWKNLRSGKSNRLLPFDSNLDATASTVAIVDQLMSH